MPSEAQKLICESAGINEDEYHRRIEMYKESSKKDERNRIWLSEYLLTLARDYRGKTIAINYEKGVVAGNSYDAFDFACDDSCGDNIFLGQEFYWRLDKQTGFCDRFIV